MRKAALILSAFVAGVLLYCATLPNLTLAGDLEIYRAAARAANPYDARQVVAAMTAEGRAVKWVLDWADARGCSPFFYPPLVWWGMKPLGALDYRAAFAAMTALTLVAFGVLVARTPRGAREDFAILALPTIAMNIAVGQINVMLVALADLGLAGLAAVCKPFLLASWRSRREAILNGAVFGALMLAQTLAAPALFRAWLGNLPCLDALGGTGAWQAGIRALLPVPAGAREWLWLAGLAVGGPLGLALAALLTSASWVPYDVFFLPLLRKRLAEGASPVVHAAWALMVIGNLPFLPPILGAVGRVALLTESAIRGIKRAKRPAGGSPRAGRFFVIHPSHFKEVRE
ncbi:MAG: glycosyltransferase 87 family protein [Armatimonadota bacterium]|nr:glycosyltransferase 87 family protein [Armatimonadota bacterium]